MAGPLSRFLALYAALFAAFGVASPFLPGLLASDGLDPNGIGVVLAAGTAIRLLAGPAGGRLADRSGAPRQVLIGLLIAASVLALGYLPARGLAPLLLVSVLHASLLAPITPIADALALGAAQSAGPRRFQYGWVRGAGSARLMLIAALVEGSHALHDGFEVIRWQAAGIGPGTAGLLWSEAVAAEVLVFAGLGQVLLDRLGAGGAAMLAAAAGVLRWGVMAQTAWLPAMALVEPLHGLTFALMHLTCMRLMMRLVPVHLAATAQAFYGTVAVGAMTALLTLASGPLYQRLGATSSGSCRAYAPLPCRWLAPCAGWRPGRCRPVLERDRQGPIRPQNEGGAFQRCSRGGCG